MRPPATQDAVQETVPAEDSLTTLRTLVGVALDDLRRLAPRLATITAHPGDAQKPMGSFLTPEALRRRDAAVREERLAHASRPARPVGHRWLDPATVIAAAGHTAAPVALDATSVHAEIQAHLADLVTRLTLRLRLVGVCWAGERRRRLDAASSGRERLTVDELADLTSGLVALVANHDRLRRIHRDLEHLVARADVAVNGADTDALPEPCPHCGRRTLVVHHRQSVIRCEHDPDTGRHERCRCDDPYCACGRGRRHEWHRAQKGHLATSWRGLHRAQQQILNHHRKEAMAQAAIERVRDLHQPGTWVDVDGERTWQPHHVWVGFDQVPPDHDCVHDGEELTDSCEGYPEDDPADVLHVVPACTECRAPTEDGDPGWSPWPCDTLRALEPADDETTS